MKAKIYRSMRILTFISILLSVAVLCGVYYFQLSGIVRSELRERAQLLKNMPVSQPDAFAALRMTDMRLTLISPAGKVLYDNVRDANTLDNHADREEFLAAVASGSGESKRFSDTLSQETYYYAVRLSDGSVLRLAKTTSSIWGLLTSTLPYAALVLIIGIIFGYIISGRLAAGIIRPINEIDLSDELRAPYDELAPFIRTISQQRETIREQFSDLQKRTDTIDAIMDNMKEGIIIVNRQGVILTLNKSVLGVFAVAGDMRGRNILELIRDLELLDRIRDALTGKSSDMGFTHGEQIFQIFFSPAAGDGAIILFLDITAKAKADKMRQEFSANVSHELKTPLTSISGYAEMIAGGMVLEKDILGFSQKIKDEVGRLIALIEDIIMLSELDEGNTLAKEPVNITAIAAEVSDALESKAAEAKVTLALEFKPEKENTSALLSGNRFLLFELLYNLVDNGIKYNQAGGKVQITISQLSEQIQITVSDTGIGIPPEHQDRIFERFYRVDRSRSKKTGGTGLGLSIVKHAALAHEGSVSLRSRENEGTTITVTLPAHGSPA